MNTQTKTGMASGPAKGNAPKGIRADQLRQQSDKARLRGDDLTADQLLEDAIQLETEAAQ